MSVGVAVTSPAGMGVGKITRVNVGVAKACIAVDVDNPGVEVGVGVSVGTGVSVATDVLVTTITTGCGSSTIASSVWPWKYIRATATVATNTADQTNKTNTAATASVKDIVLG